MVLKAVTQKSVSQLKNGLSSFVLPCKRITIKYCNWGGSSTGMRRFLEHKLKGYAAANPEIEFRVEKRSGHPVVIGEYGPTKATKPICVRNLDMNQIENKLNLLKNTSGAPLKPWKANPVKSTNPSVRGIWSPFHVNPSIRHKV